MHRWANRDDIRPVWELDIEALIREKGGICLDIGCGDDKQKNFIGLDKRPLPGADIVHDLEVFPYPLPDECCLTIVGSHIIEHIKPWLTIDFFNELWRILKPKGQLALATPYAGSPPYWQDPTHCNGFTEVTFQYFDPDYPMYAIYHPRPWKIAKGYPVWQTTGILEVLLEKRPMEVKDGG